MDIQKVSSDQLILGTLLPVNFLLSLLIVFHHAFTVDVDYAGSFALYVYGISTAFQRFMYNLSECAVPVFFFISAFLFYRTFDGTWANYKEKIRRRIRSLFIPYILFSTLGYVKALAFNNGLLGGNFSDYIISIWESNTMPLWFIRELMALSLLAPVFWRLLKRPWLSVLVCVVILTLTIVGIVPYRSFVYWIPVYLLGASYKFSYWDSLVDILNRNVVQFVSVIFILLYAASAWYLPNGITREDMSLTQNASFAIFRLLTPIIWIFIVWWIFEFDVKGRDFMRYSFFVYCLHAPIIALVRMVYEKMMPSSMLNETIKYVTIVFFTYTICVVVAIILKRYVPAVWQILNGGRQ